MNMWDNSSIIMGDQRGQMMGAAIQQTGRNFTQGIERYYQRKQEQERQEQTVNWLETSGAANNLFPQLAQVKDPAERRKVITAGIKGAGLDNMVQVAQLDEQRKQREAEAAREAEWNRQRIAESQMRARKMEEDLAADRREEGALKSAFQPVPEDLENYASRGGYVLRSPGARQSRDAVPEEMVTRYGRAGGRNPETIKAIASLQPKEKKPRPGSKGYSKVTIPGIGEIVQDDATGEPIDSGKLVRPDKKNDEKSLTTQELQQIQALDQSVRDLDTLEGAYGELKDEDWGGPVAGRIREVANLGTDPSISRIDNLVTSATPNLARGVFREVGVLTDEDIKRYRRLLPTYTDTSAQRKQKFADLRSRLQQSTTETLATLKAAGRDVSGLEEKLAKGQQRPPANKKEEVRMAAIRVGTGTSPLWQDFASTAEVGAALASGKLKSGAVVRVGGKLFRASPAK